MRNYGAENNEIGKDMIGLKVIKGIFTFLIYLVMFILVCMFFTGNGTFIYEAF